MTYYCQIADQHGTIHHCKHTCLKQCETCKPNYPVPAIPVRVDLGTWYENIVMINDGNGEDPVILAMWDYNTDGKPWFMHCR